MAPSTTRSKAKAKGPAPKTGAGATSATTQKKPVQPDSKNPPKLFVLPKDVSSEARIATLAHPRTSDPTRYFICPEKGFFEFTKIAAPKSQPRSWLLAPNEEECAAEDSQTTSNGKKEATVKDEGNEYTPSEGYITSSADLFLATPIDPLFLLLPALAGKSSKPKEEPKRLFLEADDYLDILSSASPHLKSLLSQDSLRSKFTDRLDAVCDTVDAGETMYRLSEPKLIAILAEKCTTVVEKGLPASMEDLLVSKALAVPLLSVTRGEDCPDEEPEVADAESSATPKTESAESQTPSSATDSSATPVSEASTALTTPSPDAKPPIVAPEGVPHLLRLRTAFQYLCSSYIPASLSASLATKLNTPFPDQAASFPDFTPLDTHLAHLAKLRADAIASRSMNDFSRKRGFEDEEAGETRAEKKRKKEEEEKLAKKNESRGVRDLKKVNVSGMKKMSDFFKKKT
ncbi:hypothetical protein V499_08240 [Pseudogymnoascus sp. VKM F-103]|uniref:Ribonuclease H2 subunit B n=1 Tax=Pseudogymnoascus verrucosus TaxID=342668 RepID=A0A2P2SXA9_9PEZI|nr:uncharacterized protein VE01_00449 [Pseudogymnoascus verrucosus]KFY71580.1 hypothetical protein V499_08240 [Pseudogymnoascus sp. VKM F-103]OBU01463.1 hypothetical protein VE01_00449 [Pseudogymnoascus verrucosus]